jgi:hypothetical protein
MTEAAYHVVMNTKYWQLIAVLILSLILYFTNDHNLMYKLPPSMPLLTPPSKLCLDYTHDVCAEEVVACGRRFRLILVSDTCRKPDTYQTFFIVN